MNRSKLINLTMPAFFVGFFVWVILSTMSMEKSEAIFPRMIGVFSLAVSFFQLYSDLKKADHKDKFQNSNVLKVLEATAVLFIYILLMKKIGCLIDTVLLSFYTMYALGYRKLKVAVPVSVLLTLVVFLVFKLLLRVPLPMLFFDF
ncbi:tripartite tricarboxylate transporter TctB family protein [Marasmitruncus massiliensis]|uniref:tripartite tricarboxylate transporter TctB family protein n=1 Tax=Marasmitruncus massiliensis TaxID=1944642 RepID=UPI000C7C6A38|nr:tripartite tricarboxylate transporter TctB family protein [Marasmitruncus massiliensis]